MATTAAAIGSPNVNTKAASTVATRMARPKQAAMKPGTMKPGRFNQQKFQNPGAGTGMARTADRSRFQNPGAGGSPSMRNMQGYGQSRGQVPGQYQTPGKPPMGGQSGGQYPGDTNWWQNTPQMPPQRQWGSPQFNYMGGNAPSASPGGGPNWGQGGGRGGYNQMGGYGMSGGGGQWGGGGGGGMPQGGMPGYGAQQFGNGAYGELQNRTYQQQMLNNMPWQLRDQYNFQQGAGGLGYDPQSQSGQGQMFQGYGSMWGHNPQGWTGGSMGGAPFSTKWGTYSPNSQQGSGQQAQTGGGYPTPRPGGGMPFMGPGFGGTFRR